MMRFFRFLNYCSKTFFFLAVALMPALPANIGLASEGENLVFILDGSGSMWGQVKGRHKIVIAKQVMTELIQELPAGLNTGLVAYGHRRKGDCNDVEQPAPLGPLDKKKMIEIIKAINPKGKTPLTHSIQITAERLKSLEEKTTIVLVSDGIPFKVLLSQQYQLSPYLAKKVEYSTGQRVA